jgi:hypothetical protein
LPDQFGSRLKRSFDATAKLEQLAIAQATLLMSIDCLPHVPRFEARRRLVHVADQLIATLYFKFFFAHMVNCRLIADPTDVEPRCFIDRGNCTGHRCPSLPKMRPDFDVKILC